jgi:hypothetical protein
MPRHLRRLLLYACLLLGLAGCTTSTYSGLPTPLPCAAQTAAAATATPTPSLGTRTSGPLVITTDRTVYAPSDMVVVTVTNQIHASLNLPVVVDFGLRQRCPDLYQAERLQSGVWEDVPVCSAPTEGGDATLVGQQLSGLHRARRMRSA